MKTIVIRIIPHKDHRYPTVGDWWWDGDNLEIRVSQLSDWRREAAIAMHEMGEAFLCKHAGITAEMVDEFDIEFEKRREKSLVLSTAEPGDDHQAPYRLPHFRMTTLERLFTDWMDVDWGEYETELNGLE